MTLLTFGDFYMLYHLHDITWRHITKIYTHRLHDWYTYAKKYGISVTFHAITNNAPTWQILRFSMGTKFPMRMIYRQTNQIDLVHSLKSLYKSRCLKYTIVTWKCISSNERLTRPTYKMNPSIRFFGWNINQTLLCIFKFAWAKTANYLRYNELKLIISHRFDWLLFQSYFGQ